MEGYKRFSDYRAPHPRGTVGGDVEAWCTHCHMMQEHSVLAATKGEPARVMCNTCKGQHKYRACPPGSSKKKRAPGRTKMSQGRPAPGSRRSERDWQETTRNKDLSNPLAYHPGQIHAAGQVILHGKFGTGVVVEVKPRDKIVVVFADATRILVHARK